MLDTVWLSTQDFSLKRDHLFEVRDSDKPQVDSLSGEVRRVKSSKLIANLDKLSVDIPFPDRTDRRLFLKTSLPKLVHGTSLYEIREPDFPRCVEAIETRLAGVGVKVSHNNLSDFSLSRVDFCSNIPIDYRPAEYLAALSGFTMSRRAKRDIDHETLTFQNRDRELTFYNKVREILDTSKDQGVLALVKDRPENILRIETRLKRGRAIARELESDNLHLVDMFNLSLSREVLLRDMDRLVAGPGEQLDFNFTGNLELYHTIKARRKRGAFDELMKAKGVRVFLAELGNDWVKVREFLLACGLSRPQVYRHLLSLRGSFALALEARERDLIGELRGKLLLAA